MLRASGSQVWNPTEVHAEINEPRILERTVERLRILNGPAAVVDYSGTAIPVNIAQQLFDADQQLLVSFANICRILPWGSNSK